MFFASAESVILLFNSSRTEKKSNACISKVNFPASIFEKSRISLIMVSRLLAENRMALRFSEEFSSNFLLIRSSVSPMIAFIGVLISWLILERNADLARASASAASLS